MTQVTRSLLTWAHWLDGVIFWCDWNGARVNKDRVTCVTNPSNICVLTTLGGYGTSLDLVLWEVLIDVSRVVVIEKNVLGWLWEGSIRSCLGWADASYSSYGSLVRAG